MLLAADLNKRQEECCQYTASKQHQEAAVPAGGFNDKSNECACSQVTEQVSEQTSQTNRCTYSELRNEVDCAKANQELWYIDETADNGYGDRNYQHVRRLPIYERSQQDSDHADDTERHPVAFEQLVAKDTDYERAYNCRPSNTANAT